jgi:hypothetical protein
MEHYREVQIIQWEKSKSMFALAIEATFEWKS